MVAKPLMARLPSTITSLGGMPSAEVFIPKIATMNLKKQRLRAVEAREQKNLGRKEKYGGLKQAKSLSATCYPTLTRQFVRDVWLSFFTSSTSRMTALG